MIDAARLKRPKPELPTAWAWWIAEAIRLDALRQAGATFAYPDALSAEAWAALAGLQQGRAKADEAQAERDELQRRQREAQARNGGMTF